MSDASVVTDIDRRGVATVTLCRADKHNAFDDAVIAQLRAAFDELATRQDVRVVILASEGKSFSAGADLGWMQRMANYDYQDNLADSQLLAAMLSALYTLPQPTIARVQGAAFGGAVGLICCCDMAVASDHAAFAFSEVKIGLVPATISPYVIRAIGERASRRYFMSGERFDAPTALQLGLVHEIADSGELDQRLDALVEALLQNGPQAVRGAKALIDAVAGKDIDAALIADTCERISAIRVSPEGQEGLNAFLEKRKPGWQ